MLTGYPTTRRGEGQGVCVLQRGHQNPWSPFCHQEMPEVLKPEVSATHQ